MREKYESQIEEFKTALLEKEGEREEAINALKDIMNGLHVENDKLKADLQQMQKENELLKEKVDEFDNGLNGVRQENESNDAKVEQLESKNNELERGLNGLNKEMKELKNNMDAIQSENVDLKQDVDDLRVDLEAVTDSKMKMIEGCNEQINVLRKGVVIYQKQKHNWLPFSIDFKWE